MLDSSGFIWKDILLENEKNCSPYTSSNYTVIQIGHEAYIVGEDKRQQTFEVIWKVDFIQNNLSQVHSHIVANPSTRSVFLKDDFIYVYRNRLKTMEKFDLILGSFSTDEATGEFPEATTGFSTDYLDATNELVLYGGLLDDRYSTSRVNVFNLKSKKWKTPKISGQYPTPRWNHASCVAVNSVFIYGGRGTGQRSLKDLHILAYGQGGYVWSSPQIHRPTISAMSYVSIQACGGRLFIFRSNRGGSYNTDLYEIDSRKWNFVERLKSRSGNFYALNSSKVNIGFPTAYIPTKGIFTFGGGPDAWLVDIRKLRLLTWI